MFKYNQKKVMFKYNQKKKLCLNIIKKKVMFKYNQKPFFFGKGFFCKKKLI